MNLATKLYNQLLQISLTDSMSTTHINKLRSIYWTTNLTNVDEAISIIATYLKEFNIDNVEDVYTEFGVKLQDE